MGESGVTSGTHRLRREFRRALPGPRPAGGDPWRLALVTVMQFAEGLSDRQAAEVVRARIDWKYAWAWT